jgi:CheY-like chemotaxis protein
MDHLALVVTNDLHSIRVLEENLPQFSFRVVICSDSYSAVRHLTTLQPGLTVLDLQLPNSFEILRHAHLRAARLIILTADVVCIHLTGRAVDAELLQPISVQAVADVLHHMPEFAQSR